MIKSERVTFRGSLGDELAARLERPAPEPATGKPAAYAIFAHCFTCSKDLKTVSRISRALVDRGIAVLRFDFTGLGDSEGDFANTNFSSNVRDLLAAADFMRREYRAPQLLVGHSLGGTAVLTAAGEVPEVRAVATIAAASDTGHLHGALLRKAPELADGGEAEVTLAGRTFRVKQQLLDDLREQRVLDAVRRLNRALLVMHSPADQVVEIDHARRIFEAARHPKSFVSLGDADHLLLASPEDARYVAEVLAAWAGRYLAAAGPAPAAAEQAGSEEEVPPGEVRVSAGASGLVQRVRVGRHELVADEPLNVPGGTDAGPAPYELLLAAHGSCTAMTLRMYAGHKGWPLGEIDVRLRHAKVPAGECPECATTSGRVDRIERRIALGGELSEEQRQRLLEIADRCPIHRTLTSEVVIRSQLA